MRKNKKGITLIELLVVMAIMAILSSITFVAVQHMITKNRYDAGVNKIRASIDICNRATETLNQGVGEFGGVVCITNDELITPDNFQNAISNSIPKEYDVIVQGNGFAPTMEESLEKDCIIIYVEGVALLNKVDNQFYGGQNLNRNTNLVVKGGWFIPQGELEATITFIQSERKDYSEAKNIS